MNGAVKEQIASCKCKQKYMHMYMYEIMINEQIQDKIEVLKCFSLLY